MTTIRGFAARDIAETRALETEESFLDDVHEVMNDDIARGGHTDGCRVHYACPSMGMQERRKLKL